MLYYITPETTGFGADAQNSLSPSNRIDRVQPSSPYFLILSKASPAASGTRRNASANRLAKAVEKVCSASKSA